MAGPEGTPPKPFLAPDNGGGAGGGPNPASDADREAAKQRVKAAQDAVKASKKIEPPKDNPPVPDKGGKRDKGEKRAKRDGEERKEQVSLPTIEIDEPKVVQKEEFEGKRKALKEIDERVKNIGLIMEEGMRSDVESFGPVWERFDEYVRLTQQGETSNHLAEVLAAMPSHKDFYKKIDELKKGANWRQIANVDPKADPGYESFTENSLRQVELVAAFMDGAVRTQWGPGKFVGYSRWEKLGPGEREHARAAQLAYWWAKGERIKKGWLSPEEQGRKNDYLEQIRKLASSHDIPPDFRGRLHEVLAKEKKAGLIKATRKPESTKQSEPAEAKATKDDLIQKLDSWQQEQAAKKSTFAGRIEIWQQAKAAEEPKASEGVKREPQSYATELFGKKVEISGKDMGKLSLQITALINEAGSKELKKKDPQRVAQAAFQAARELANLKRAGVIMTNEAQAKKVEDVLRARRDEVFSRGDEVGAHYLMLLKSIGVIQSLRQEEGEMIRRGVAQLLTRTMQGERTNLLQMLVNGKYLGLGVGPKLVPYCEKEFEMAVKSADAHQMIYELGRLRNLGVMSKTLEKLTKRATPVIQEYLAKGMGEGASREKFLNEYLVATSIAKVPGLGSINPEGLLAHEASVRAEAVAQPGMWARFTVYLGSLKQLSRYLKNPKSETMAAPALAEEGAGFWKRMSGKMSEFYKTWMEDPSVKVVDKVLELLNTSTPKPEQPILAEAVPTQPIPPVVRQPAEQSAPVEVGEESDEALAKKFWERKQPAGLREAFMENIQKAVDKGQFSLFVGGTKTDQGKSEINQAGKEEWSAYRVLALEMGYTIGPVEYDPRSGTATATITKAGT